MGRRRMKNSFSITHATIGGMVLSFVVLFIFVFFRCSNCEMKIYTGYFKEDDMKSLNFQEKVHYNRLNNMNRIGDMTYLDYATKVVYPDSIINNLTLQLRTTLYGNTHSESPSSDRSTNAVENLRRAILKYLGTSLSHYQVVFTYSGGQALKTLAEAIPFNSSSTFLFSETSNNNILGLRYYASEKGANVKSFKFDDLESQISSLSKDAFNLVCFPLVDQFDGSVLTVDQMKSIGSLRNDPKTISLVDITHYLTFNRLNLSEVRFSCVAFDFDKFVGYPKLGVLLIENDLIFSLDKPYFGGGTLVYALPSKDVVKLRLRPSERFEDGSLPFLNIVAAANGLDFANSLNWYDVHQNVAKLSNRLLEIINGVIYSDGSKATIVYGVESSSSTSSIISFNFIDKSGKVKPYEPYLQSALNHNIMISAGCHNTPGTCYKLLGINQNDLLENIHNVKIDSIGSLRVSLGWASSQEDIDKFSEWIHFVVN